MSCVGEKHRIVHADTEISDWMHKSKRPRRMQNSSTLRRFHDVDEYEKDPLGHDVWTWEHNSGHKQVRVCVRFYV